MSHISYKILPFSKKCHLDNPPRVKRFCSLYSRLLTTAKNMRKIYLFLLVCIALISCGHTQKVPTNEEGNIASVSGEDAEMNAAIQRAQDTLPLFIKALQSPKPTQTSFLIKAKFPYGGSNAAEHLWIRDITYNGKQFEGFLANEPLYVQNMHLGDRIIVKMTDVSDWMIIEDGKLLGGFTIYVLRNRMSESERKQFDSQMEYTIGDAPLLP